MPFKKGQSGNPKGRGKGAKSKLSESFWLDWLEVYNRLGGVEAMEKWAKESKRNLIVFFNWGAKTIPSNVDVKQSGEVKHEGKLTIEVIQTKIGS